jgi:YlmC/YmxH family sporulation protein
VGCAGEVLSMRLSELEGKEMINLFDGGRLGSIGESDMIIEPESGEIESIIIPGRSSFFNFWSERQEMTVPWNTVKKIGSEVIVVDLDQTYSVYRNYT